MKKRTKASEKNGFDGWGGYMNAKLSKLQEQFVEDTIKNNIYKKSDLFQGISIFVNGYTKPSADELKRIMMAYGGVFHHYQRSTTTYVIASNLPDVKIRSITTDKIIKPDWIVDCLKENKILDYSKYLLYTNQKVSQPKLLFVNENNDIVRDLEVLNQKCQGNLRTSQKTPVPFDGEDSSESFEPLVMPETPEKEEQNSESTQSDTFTENALQISVKHTNSSKLAKTAVDPNFLSEFYNNSRLHHISTLGAGFKQHINDLREFSENRFPERQKLIKNFEAISDETETTIMHIDMDCFFVSVGLRTRPQLKGQPVAVTHSKGGDGVVAPRDGVSRKLEVDLYNKRLKEKYNDNVPPKVVLDPIDEHNSMAEIASCSYEARKMGVKNGMFVGTALKLCPKLKTIPYDFAGYKEVGFTLYNTIAGYTLDIEAVSCDEMFVDLTSLLKEVKISAETFVTYLRKEIQDKTGCPCSVGVGENRLQARLATKKAKPNGQFFLDKTKAKDFMRMILIADLPGVGYATTNRLLHFGWKYCGDLRNISLVLLQKEFGKKFGETLYHSSRGIDERPLIFGQIRKSVSADVNYGIRFAEYDEVETFLKQLCAEVHRRLTEIKRQGKCITLKLLVRAKDAPVETSKFMGHGVCDYINKSVSLLDYTSDLDVITSSVLSVMKSITTPPNELRGIGIQITKLNLIQNKDDIKKNSIMQLFDRVKQRQNEENSVDTENNIKPALEIPKTPTKTIISNNVKSPGNILTSPSSNKTIRPITNSRGRGRKNQIMPKSNFKTLPNIFVNSMTTITESKKKNEMDYCENIDMAILEELPDDIRNEVIRDHHINYKPAEPLEISQEEEENKLIVNKEFLEALPLSLRQEIEKEIAAKPDKFVVRNCGTPETIINLSAADNSPINAQQTGELRLTQILNDNILMKPDWRNLLKSWIESNETPYDDDIEMITKSSKELIMSRNWDDLYIKLRYFHRIIEENNICSWHSAYYKIINFIQTEMLEITKLKLSVRYDFKCNNDNNCKQFLIY